MCRLFACVGAPDDLTPYLVGAGSLESLAREHADGWGLASWRGGRSTLRKEPAAADDPKSGWRDAVADAAGSDVLVAHLRDASIGGASVDNTHPFAYGGWVFLHNGTVRGIEARRDAILAEVEPTVRPAVRGRTDSELAFALFLHRLLAYPEGLATPVEEAVPALSAVARRLRREFPGTPDEPTETTFVAANAGGVVALRGGKELSVLQGEGFAALASVPLGPDEGWRAVPEGASVLLVDGRVRVRVP